MALMAGSLGALLALPLAFLGARNIMPRRPLGNLVYYLSRSIMNLARAVEPLVLAAIFAVWMGLGSPFGGVLALIWVTMANLGKLFSESVEDIDAGPLEALEATGAGRLQRIRYAVLPQVLPPFLAFGIYQWDINLRLSVILGFVGAGGIGFALYEWMKVTQWRAAAVAILAIILVVTAMDTISARLRARLV
jgi:phosphonate transport system permease protein